MTLLQRFLKKLSKPSRTLRCPHVGEVYNLREIYERINAQYFDGKLALKIAWVGNRYSRPRTRVLFGSYDPYKKVIKIHRRLDQAHVPEYFISYVVYHEMLHHILPPVPARRGRRKIHHPAFLAKEKEFQEYAQAEAFGERSRRMWFK